MKAGLYCRVSTDEQARHGFSLEAQQETAMKYITEFKHELFKIYVDDGYSAKNMNRPALQEMLEDIKQKKIELIVIWRLDRLSRNTLDGLYMVYDIFNKYGVSFVSMMEKHDLTTAQGRWMFTISLANAQSEREVIGERVTFGQSKKARLGKRVTLGLIYGYDVIDGKLVINEGQAGIVRNIFNMYVYQGYGYGKIAQTLNEENVPSKRNRKWVAVTIKGILQNSTYIGKNEWKPKHQDPIIVDGEHEPIISNELFNLAQNQLERRNNMDISRSSYNFPFSSILKCGDCGGSYHSHNSIKRRNDRISYTNYRCQNRKNGACTSSDIAELKLEKLFFDYFTHMHIQAEEYTPKVSPTEQKNIDKDKKRLMKEIQKQETRKNNLALDLADRIVSREDYRDTMKGINETLERLKRDLDALEPKQEKTVRSSEEIIQFIKNLKNDWNFMNNEDRKFVIQMMFKKIIIKKENGIWRILDIEPA